MIATKTKVIRTIFLFLIFLTGSKTSMAQEVDPSELLQKKSGKTWRLAKEAKRTNNNYLALEYFDQLYALDSNDLDLIYEMAELYRRTNNYKLAEKFYSTITSSKLGNKHPETYFYLGQAQKSNQKYADALKSFEKFKKMASALGDARLSKLYKIEIAGCKLAIDSTESKVQTASLGNNVNQPHIDFSPIPLSDEKIIYGSFKENKERVYALNDTLPLEVDKRRFYIAEKIDNTWKRTSPLPNPFNDDEFDVANGCFSLDSSRFYFTKCQPNWQYKMICAIYESKLSNGKWSSPEKLNELVNLPNFTSTHPTMGRESRRNREVMYFASDREGSKGGMDIWFSEYDPRKKDFRKPRNVGSRLNTVGNEMTPFYDLASKTLYFATDGWPSIGGLDVYASIGEASSWQPAVWGGNGINSSADDLDFALKPSNRGGFFVSNRKGGESLYHETCCDDIYEFEYNEFIEITCKLCVYGPNKEILNGDALVNVYIADSAGNLLVTTRKMADFCTNFLLRPGKKYIFEVKKDGYYPGKGTVSTEGIIKSTQLEEEIELEKVPAEPIIIGNIRYDFDSPNLTNDSKNILDTTLVLLFKKYPNLKIEIRAHTDSKGSDAYNLKLSQKRAESVVRYLKSKGISETQMIATGYGESLPLVPNETPEGKDDPKGREKNRRTEFKVLGEIEEELINIDEEDEE